ncbi:MAG: 1-(5-phosphoribosyl)-5-[(5-phosphoribosylamino)methylideneamino]imidazole-4-carboxamide isomerase [Desulfobacterales bacterium]|jgi:phosphoribosylformimino-5-aminoimidazole carboxamide ribotide isomerase
MIIIPAVDIKDGRCVRLLQGEMDRETVFSDDPTAMARRWEAQGAELIHLVDLNGAVDKQPRNRKTIEEILAGVRAPVQLGGGIRDIRTIEDYIQLGVARIVLGTEAIRRPDFVFQAAKAFPGRIVVGIDARDGYVAIEGWTQTTRTRAVDLARYFEDAGIAAINFTDIYRDGMQSGPNLEATRRLAEAVAIPVVASGGVSSIEDIHNLLPLESAGVQGVITGKALYSGTLDLREAIALARSAGISGA